MKRWLYLLLLIASPSLQSVEFETLETIILAADPVYKMHAIPGKSSNEKVTLCFHGSGSDYQIGDILHSYQIIPNHIVSFNFPPRAADATIDQLLPALYALRKVVIEAKAREVNLYGFSAGAGSVVNAIAVLNSTRYDTELRSIGITMSGRKQLLGAIQRGSIILDAPFKSMEEIYGIHRKSPALARQLQKKQMRPIDSLEGFKGLNLNVLIFFQNPDESVKNRDDRLFAERLRKFNPQGINRVISADDGGHLSYHRSLWNAYPEFVSETEKTR